MTKHVLAFLGAFLVGATLAFALRTARHDPYAAPAAAETPATRPAPAVAPAADPHAGHASAPAAAPTVNSVCAICGMDVDPAIKPATYQGKLVGFGCAACPAKFAREPDRYGPAALRNEVAAK